MPAANQSRGEEQEMLARWLATAERERSSAPAAPPMLWTNVYSTPSYAYLWYSARSAGEQLRAVALQRLYTVRNHPGGVYPDPREPGAFSHKAVLSVAARQANVRVWQLPPTSAEQACGAPAADEAPIGNRSSLAWIQLYGPCQLPDIVVRPTRHLQRLHFEIAMCLGMVWKEAGRYRDPSAPPGAVTLPTDQPLVSVLHRFAIALLAVGRDCPAEWTCACNALRRSYNAVPPDHPQPTDVLDTRALQVELARQQQASVHGQDEQTTVPSRIGPTSRPAAPIPPPPNSTSAPQSPGIDWRPTHYDPRLYTGRLQLPEDLEDDKQ